MGRMPQRAMTLLCLALAALAGCASVPPPHAGGAAAREYFPLLPGTHWVYELRTGPFSHTTLDVTARGSRPVRGSDARIFLVEERTEGEMFGLDPFGLVGYQVDGGFVRPPGGRARPRRRGARVRARRGVAPAHRPAARPGVERRGRRLRRPRADQVEAELDRPHRERRPRARGGGHLRGRDRGAQ